MNDTQRDKTVSALRVLAEAVKQGLVMDRPRGVIVYGRGLAPVELRWLVEGMDTVTVKPLATPGVQGEEREIVGYVLGRVYRIEVRTARLAELHDVLRTPARTR